MTSGPRRFAHRAVPGILIANIIVGLQWDGLLVRFGLGHGCCLFCLFLARSNNDGSTSLLGVRSWETFKPYKIESNLRKLIRMCLKPCVRTGADGAIFGAGCRF